MFSRRWLLLSLSLLILLAGWTLLAWYYPSYVVPSISGVLSRLLSLALHGDLMTHLLGTLLPTLSGFLVTAIYATLLAFFTVEFRLARYLVWPYVILLQSIPVIAILPLLVIWFGNTALTVLLIVVVITFYPIYQSAIKAFEQRETHLLTLLQSYHTGRWQRFIALDLPLAVPQLFAGLRVGIASALIGSVVYELLLGHQGLGYLVGLGRARFDTALVFAALVCLVVVGLALQGLVALLEKIARAIR